ncbi:UDP-glucose 4-epimerase [Subtercola boreus]|uniref:UDP-glucose 4-epimerase n=1 Tax=Subtercola boreus TaxID=120213 RepID=A0A3E0W2Q7_9MICO|nr:NAD-dependent epimerase/dehydratase family protein [Subtercola boreus]RFA16446.1 UDP-glucose 4-epimerase [Subtercola boreus]
MRMFITGVAGFVGSTLAKRLLAEGHEVVGIDCLSDYYEIEIKRANLESLESPGFTFIEEDLNVADLDHLLEGIDVVFHQAGQPGVRKSWGSDFSIYLSANIEATQKLLEAARKNGGLKRFVYASSSSVYGNAERYPTLEMDRPRPMSPYGVTKLAAEHLCSLYAENFGIPTVSLRYFTVYGPRQRTDMAFTRFVRAAVRGEQITIFGTGEQIRDFTFVDDIVEANVKAALVDSPKGSVFNVAGGSNISVNNVLALLGTISEKPLDVKYIDGVAGDVFRTGGSTDSIEEVLGWKASVPLEEGLRRQYEWARVAFAAPVL